MDVLQDLAAVVEVLLYSLEFKILLCLLAPFRSGNSFIGELSQANQSIQNRVSGILYKFMLECLSTVGKYCICLFDSSFVCDLDFEKKFFLYYKKS